MPRRFSRSRSLGRPKGSSSSRPDGGRRREDAGSHGVTKTKESHHRGTNRAAVVEKQTWPTTAAGIQLATEIKNAPGLSEDTKAKLTREIMDHEATHGQCTKTFLKKI